MYKYEDYRGFPNEVMLYIKFRVEVSAAQNSSKFHKSSQINPLNTELNPICQ